MSFEYIDSARTAISDIILIEPVVYIDIGLGNLTYMILGHFMTCCTELFLSMVTNCRIYCLRSVSV